MASSRGLSIRIISAEEPFMKTDFGETQALTRLMVDYANMAAKERALLNRMEIATLEEERFLLEELSSRKQYVATLLSIRAVGVKGEPYSYCVPLSYDQTQPNWNDLDRVCYIFGKPSTHSIMPAISRFSTVSFTGFYDWTS
ncbi:hypothetical protein OUZ56_033542 [Daphnia magna]|uniref:GMP synthase n=1 Tax=Daphnia magna TaxID=35525 RepID=A0ABQ9ZXY3_9CRUS|nr:hypothetical protein OUZ56_033542 [Daphnia magna]